MHLALLLKCYEKDIAEITATSSHNLHGYDNNKFNSLYTTVHIKALFKSIILIDAVITYGLLNVRKMMENFICYVINHEMYSFVSPLRR